MNASMDPDLLKLVQQNVNTLKTEVDQLTFEVQEDKERVSQALKDISTRLDELEARFLNMRREQEVLKQEQSSLSEKVDFLHADVEDVKQRVARVEDKLNLATLPENLGKCLFSEVILGSHRSSKFQEAISINNNTSVNLPRFYM